MKQTNKILWILMPLVALVACSKTDTLEEEVPAGPIDGMVLSATVDEQETKTTSFYQTYCGTLSGSSHSYTYPWTSFTKNRPWRRLDYVLTKNGSSQIITPVEYRTVRRTYTAEDDEVRTASDHLPVVVKVNFN